ncbi:glucosyltransferase [Salinibacter sp. 10B]|uniref:cellulose synthase family protein n=1 Tax=Salinibacter sp. 10B TaxID=1923971 RepID=UPI000CF53C7F|nr:cellulose synthase family protein [Salinibacter sp. 10B]PQJ36104.1 glucosyltransferase [Salinibacter sp. 10B]
MLATLEVALPVLYAIAIVVLTAYGGNLLWLALFHAGNEQLIDGPVPDHTSVPAPPDDWPVVTVQLPLYNEAEVAHRLIDACVDLDYPREKLEIQVLDDSTDATTERVANRVDYWQAQGIDIVHVRRDDRTGYKAGALANGLRLARGEYVAIFDADFVPDPDFLRRMVPHFFENETLGMVQARWGHLNQDDSLLTQVQAFGLDAHFAIEQHVREQADCFMNFNGTAGLWRRTCIEDAGGWEHDTLTEDLDLSYRAQLRDWDFKYVPSVEVPAELPPDMNALRSQQFRWAKGGVETALKLTSRLWHSDEPVRVKLQGTFHLTAHFAFPFILLAALTHAPLLLLKGLGHGPGEMYFAVMGFGLFGFLGFFLAQLFAQRRLYPDWGHRLRLFPAFMAGTMGLSLSNTNAFWQALRGTDTAFIRTPKYGGDGSDGWWQSRYAMADLPQVVWWEALLAVYCTAGLGIVIALGEWAAIPFQALFAVGFILVTASSLSQVFTVRQATPAQA